jgi:predicted deacylase
MDGNETQARALTAAEPLPDLARWRVSDTGVEHVVAREGRRPGPTAMLVALIHGNEPCGAIALDRLLATGLSPTRGRLIFCFANVAAYGRIDPGRPEAGRFVDEDMNRVWAAARLDQPGGSVELGRARALRPFADAADYLLDLHSMREGERPLLLCGTTAKGRRLAERVGYPATVVVDPGHAGGVRLRDYGPFGRAEGEKVALLVECGRHLAPASAEVAVAAALRFLKALDMLASEFMPSEPLVPQSVVEVTDVVTIATEAFAFLHPVENLSVIPAAGTPLARDGAREIRTPYDDCVLIMPVRRLVPGLTAVRLGRFLEKPESMPKTGSGPRSP